MRYIALILLLTLASCKSNDAGNSDYSNVTITPQPEKPKYDSATLATTKYAYKDIEFGVSEKEYDKQRHKLSEEIGIFEYDITPRYGDDKKLYLLEITGQPKSADYFDTEVQRQKDNLVSSITKKYGTPDSEDAYPSFSVMKTGYIHFTDTWEIGSKIIKVGVYSTTNYKYCAVCWIYDSRLYNKHEEDKAKSAESSTDKSKDNF
jgi:hypothetical protein